VASDAKRAIAIFSLFAYGSYLIAEVLPPELNLHILLNRIHAQCTSVLRDQSD
jgi:hypothetical protein